MYLFLHVPKTAGFSMWHGFRNLFGAHHVSAHLPDSFLKDEDAAALAKLQVISGHVSAQDVLRYFPDRRMMTALREPVDRCISQYYFLTSLGDPADPTCVLARSMPIEEYFSLPASIIFQTVSNRMTRQLGAHCLDGTANLRAALRRAKRLLKRCKWVGIYETLTQDMARLPEDIPSLGGLALPRERVTPQRPSVSEIGEKLRARILELNRYDVALYEWLRRRADR